MIEKLEKLNYLDNTLLIVFSDHGARLVPFAYQTEAGLIEENLPFVSIRLPKKLWGTRYEVNVQNNKNKLVTSFDIYQTLRHFLHLNKNYLKELDPSQFMINDMNTRHLRGISLLEQIPTNRSCRDAFIPENFCSCNRKPSINEKEFNNLTNITFEQVKKFLLNYINNLTKKNRNKCKLLIFERLDRVFEFFHATIKDLYNFSFSLQPIDASFQAVIKINKTNNNLSLYGKVVRLTSFGNNSNCINDKNLKLFCHC